MLELAAEGSAEVGSALSSLDSRSLRSAAVHASLGGVAEALGDVARAVLEYNLSLREEPGQPAVLRRLAALRLDQGETVRALRCLERLVTLCPKDDEARELFILTLADGGSLGPAREQLARCPDTPRWRRVHAALEGEPDAGDAEAPLAQEGEAALEPSDGDCIAFSSAFAGREGVYARQWASPTGKGGYTPIAEPFTPAVARRHLLGDVTVGIYPHRRDETVRWLCLDVDVRGSELQRTGRSRPSRDLLAAAHAVALSLVDACAREDLPTLLEDSGNKGRHVWVLFAVPIPGAAAKRVGTWLAAVAGSGEPSIQVEVFPKQGRVGAEGHGNLVKLPLGVHRVTGRRCWFLDAQGVPTARPLKLLAQAPRASIAALRAAHGKATAVMAPGAAAPPSRPTQEAPPEGVTALPEAVPYRLEDDAEARWLRSRCAVLDAVLRKAEGTRLLSEEERTVVTYTLGHLERGADAVNAALAPVLNLDRGLLLKSPLRGNPMSCPKIRAKLQELCAVVGCDCHFDAVATYPHPLVHLEGLRARARLTKAAQALSPMDIERLVRDWRKVRDDLARLTTILEDAERQLGALVDAAGTLSVAGGVVRRQDGRLCFDPSVAVPTGGTVLAEVEEKP
ncbi:MAG: hypothetical protein HY909_11120 [Deltaproteobacteria bacterium]|nr:hypothetical protein [Deltaproteobacteria bacterium]